LIIAVTTVPLVQGTLRIRAANLAGNWYDPWPNADKLTRAVALDPGSFEARVLLARALIQAGRCDQAMLQLHVAERLFPDAPSVARLREACLEPA
jgi:Flp pilus assembly protein TadD